jgi:hypothetical protein
MKYLFLFLLLISSFSCSLKNERVVHYQYKGVQITRIDRGSESTFFYGFCDNDEIECVNASVTIDWTFDNYLFGFILFNNDSTVEIIDGGGGEYKVHKNSNPRLFMKKYEYFQMADIESFVDRGDYNNLFQLSNDLELEEKRNKEFRSKIKAEY